MDPPRRANTAPETSTSTNHLKRCVIGLDQTRYLATPTALQRLLERTFQRPFDRQTITEKNNRLIYYAERELEEAEIEKWIDELEAEQEAARKARQAARAEARRTATTAAEATPAATAAN